MLTPVSPAQGLPHFRNVRITNEDGTTIEAVAGE